MAERGREIQCQQTFLFLQIAVKSINRPTAQNNATRSPMFRLGKLLFAAPVASHLFTFYNNFSPFIILFFFSKNRQKVAASDVISYHETRRLIFIPKICHLELQEGKLRGTMDRSGSC